MRLGAAALALAFLLAGCSTPDVPQPTATPTATASPTAAATTSPTPSAEPAAVTCEQLVGPGFDPTLLPPQDYFDKIRSEGSPLVLFLDYGGVLCPQSSGDEIGAFYGYSPISAADQATQEARLSSEGLVGGPWDYGILYQAPDPSNEPYALAWAFVDGTWFVASTSESLRSIVANVQP
ncbi:hypothetical protein [Schumannella luteola]